MFTFSTVIRGRLRSEQDRNKSETTGRLLANAGLQRRLRAVYALMRTMPACGPGGSACINHIDYRSVFSREWMLSVDVLFVLGQRHAKQLPDKDNLWKPVQNAMAFPSNGLIIPGSAPGDEYYTVVENDDQFTEFHIKAVPDPSVTPAQDLVVLTFTALPAPNLAMSFAV